MVRCVNYQALRRGYLLSKVNWLENWDKSTLIHLKGISNIAQLECTQVNYLFFWKCDYANFEELALPSTILDQGLALMISATYIY